MQRLGRMKHEMSTLKSTAMTGISVWNVEDDLFHLQAQILGDDSSPYKGGVFKLEIRVPDRYPFEPPHVKFLTPIYHPNIDAGGRICLDVLKMPPKGSWKPSSNIRTVLLSIQLLMNEPNPDDPLMEDISQQYKSDRHLFRQTAIRWTQRHAVQTPTDLDNLDPLDLEAAKKGEENEDKHEKENRKDAKENENSKTKDLLKDNPATKSDLDLPGSEKHSSNVGRGMTTTSTITSTTSSSTSPSIIEKSSSMTNAGAAMKLSLKPSLSSKQSSSSSSKLSSSSSSKQSSSSSANQSSSSKSSFTSSKTSLTKPISAGPVKDIFDDSFEEEEDDDFVNQTPEKNKKKVGANDDLFDEMNDSDLDLFDFDETPEKKKKKIA